ncbi:kinase-like protein, partial [Favolaschia claudopus]
QTVLDVALGITPVPGLSAAFTLLKLIVSAIEKVKQGKQRLIVLAQSAGQLLQTLNTELSLERLVQSTCLKPLEELHSLLVAIQSFVNEEQGRKFVVAFWRHDDRIEKIDGFYRQLDTLAVAFQV